jgi:hypothetical protein
MKASLLKSAFVGAVAALSSATTFAVTINSNDLLGTVVPGTPANPTNETEMVRFLAASLNAAVGPVPTYPTAGINLGDNPADSQTEVYTMWKPASLVGSAPLPGATGVQTVTSNTTLNLGAFQYDYILGKFGQDSVVFYIGNYAGEITIPNLTGNQNGLSGYLLVNPRNRDIPGVPDGGSTIAILGAGLAILAIARRKIA